MKHLQMPFEISHSIAGQAVPAAFLKPRQSCSCSTSDVRTTPRMPAVGRAAAFAPGGPHPPSAASRAGCLCGAAGAVPPQGRPRLTWCAAGAAAPLTSSSIAPKTCRCASGCWLLLRGPRARRQGRRRRPTGPWLPGQRGTDGRGRPPVAAALRCRSAGASCARCRRSGTSPGSPAAANTQV